jgi:hypothetical protein
MTRSLVACVFGTLVAISIAAVPATAVGPRADPYRAFPFHLELGGVSEADFQETTGLSTNDSVTITMERGRILDSTFSTWFEKAANGVVERKSGSIILYDYDGKPGACWKLVDAVPLAWRGPVFDSMGDTHTVEEVRLFVTLVEKC